MNIIFATTNERTAYERIKAALPEYIITEEICEPILKLVKDKEIRIGDPMMYGNVPIYPSKNYNSGTRGKIVDWMCSLKEKDVVEKEGEKEE